MDQILRPAAEWELANIVAEARDKRLPVEIVGAGSKRAIGRPVNAALGLTTSGLKGITLYEPTEMVMSARAGTPLYQIEEELGKRGQMLAFEPIDYGPAIGAEPRQGTIGAVFAANLSGARRFVAGAARDHLLGIRAVNGRAEIFKSGGRVMKNVTGVDLVRGVAGSWGTLAVLTEVTFKVLPTSEDTITLLFFGQLDDVAIELLTAAVGTPYEVTGAVHLQQGIAERLRYEAIRDQGKSVTAIRLENFTRALNYRKQKVREVLQAYGRCHELNREGSLAFWGELRELSVMPAADTLLWRISCRPTVGPKLVKAITRYMPVQAFYDWAGGLIWIEVPASADAGAADIRRVVAIHGGHATLIRAEPAVRAGVEVFQPLAPGVERLTRGLKALFDPVGILNPGRMYAKA